MNNNYFKDLLIRVSQLREIHKRSVKMNRQEIEEKVEKLTVEKNRLAYLKKKENEFVKKCLDVNVCAICGGTTSKLEELSYRVGIFECAYCGKLFGVEDYS